MTNKVNNIKMMRNKYRNIQKINNDQEEEEFVIKNMKTIINHKQK